MSFILRIFFSGLIAFIPSEDGKTITVLLLDSGSAHMHAASTTAIPPHMPMLLVSGGGCSGDCTTRNEEIAEFLYSDVASQSAAEGSLAAAVGGGAVWRLAGSELRLGIPEGGVNLVHSATVASKTIPDTPEERADFRWVANLKKINPSIGILNQELFSSAPPADLVVARLTLKSGDFSTYSVIQIDGKVTPIPFHSPAWRGRKPYVQAVASWVEAKIQVPGDNLEIVEKKFASDETRSVRVSPRNGVVEMAVLNISRPPVQRQTTALPRPGLHFERFWLLAQHPPAETERAIPRAPRVLTAQRDWSLLHPGTSERASLLLDHLLLPGGRSPYDQILCPMVQSPAP
jgi:hypothetical protein